VTSQELEWPVKVGPAQLRVLYEPALDATRQRAVFICAHGAGGHRDDAPMTAVAAELRGRGLGMVRFNFPYREQGLGRPDPMPVLEACISAVAARVRATLAPDLLLLGGRSMGGRAASMLAARGFGCDGLLLLAYPLHPAGKPEQLRDEHLSRITTAVLCLNGSRDALCRQDLMDQMVRRLDARWTMHWLQGADHSFHVLKRSGRTDADVTREVGEGVAKWVEGLGGAQTRSGYTPDTN
jgi:predicted alpha/beta-hydrolase family hydrolase